MLIVKIMSGEDCPDADARKAHRLITGVTSVVFAHTEKGGDMTVNYAGDDEEEFTLTGNVYVMNEAGKTISSFTPSGPVVAGAEGDGLPSDDLIRHMVDRFLGWRLPADFNPDAGISFKAEFNEHTDHPMRHEPTGTNLFSATQAEQMVRHMLAGLGGSRRVGFSSSRG